MVFSMAAREAATDRDVQAETPRPWILTDKPCFSIPRPGDSGIRSSGSPKGGRQIKSDEGEDP